MKKTSCQRKWKVSRVTDCSSLPRAAVPGLNSPTCADKPTTPTFWQQQGTSLGINCVLLQHVTRYKCNTSNTPTMCFPVHNSSLRCPLHYIWVDSLFRFLCYVISIQKKCYFNTTTWNVLFVGPTMWDLYIVLATFTKGRPDRVSHEAIVKVGIKRCNTSDSVGSSDNQCR